MICILLKPLEDVGLRKILLHGSLKIGAELFMELRLTLLGLSQMSRLYQMPSSSQAETGMIIYINGLLHQHLNGFVSTCHLTCPLSNKCTSVSFVTYSCVC